MIVITIDNYSAIKIKSSKKTFKNFNLNKKQVINIPNINNIKELIKFIDNLINN